MTSCSLQAKATPENSRAHRQSKGGFAEMRHCNPGQELRSSTTLPSRILSQKKKKREIPERERKPMQRIRFNGVGQKFRDKFHIYIQRRTKNIPGTKTLRMPLRLCPSQLHT